MSTLTARVAGAESHLLGEGPVWDHTRERLLWVDILAGDVLVGRLEAGRVEPTGRVHVDDYAGAVVAAADGRLLVAGRSSLVELAADGEVLGRTGVLPAGGRRRFNDGACDPAGRFVVGSLALGEPTGHEVLLRVEDDGALRTLDDDLALSNGLAWSPDGTLMYSVDTVPGIVWARPYDPATGEVGPRREHLGFEDENPDGIAVDAAGNLWVALWGAGRVRCLAPDGAVLHTVEVPAPHTTSVTFAGPGLGTLVITTASDGLDEDRRTAYPDSGRLFSVDTTPLGVRGLPATPWNGTVPRPGGPSSGGLR